MTDKPMTFDQFMEQVAKWEAWDQEFVKGWFKTLTEQPGFLAHKDEVVAEYEAAGPHRERILRNMTELAKAYRRVMARHGLPDTFVEPKGH